MWPVGPNDEYMIAEEAYYCAAHAKSECINNVVGNESAVLFCGRNDEVVLLSAFAYGCKENWWLPSRLDARGHASARRRSGCD